MVHLIDTLTDPHRPLTERIGRAAPILPGLALCAAIAALAIGLRQMTGLTALSPMILSIVLAILWQNLVGTPAAVAPGVGFTLKRLLRLGIVLLGLQITVGQVLSLGPAALAVVTLTLGATFLAILAAARVLGVARPLAELIAAGTSVCGASAVIAANTVARGSDEDVAYAVACVTLLGSVSMLAFPVLGQAMALDAAAYGVWAGATVHEVAQVAAAAFQFGDEAGQYGTLAKLSRVVMLAPLIGLLALSRRSGPDGPRSAAPVPWFVLGFVALILFSSVVALPAGAVAAAGVATTLLLSMALAAMGLQTDLRALRRRGARPMLLGVFGWAFISATGLGLVWLFGV